MVLLREFLCAVGDHIEDDERDGICAVREGWRIALRECTMHLLNHRLAAIKAGRELGGVDMTSHDLTKTVLVQMALACRSHWKPERYGGDIPTRLRDAADAFLAHRHVDVDPERLVIDRICAHLQNDDKDGVRGWNVRDVPSDLRDGLWKDMKNEYGHLDLYASVWELRENCAVPDVRAWLSGTRAQQGFMEALARNMSFWDHPYVSGSSDSEEDWSEATRSSDSETELD